MKFRYLKQDSDFFFALEFDRGFNIKVLFWLANSNLSDSVSDHSGRSLCVAVAV